jgi:hypothetical protein
MPPLPPIVSSRVNCLSKPKTFSTSWFGTKERMLIRRINGFVPLLPKPVACLPGRKIARTHVQATGPRASPSGVE